MQEKDRNKIKMLREWRQGSTVKCLPGKCEDPNPQHPHGKKSRVWWHVSNSSAGEAATGRSQGLLDSQFSRLGEFLASEGMFQKTNMNII